MCMKRRHRHLLERFFICQMFISLRWSFTGGSLNFRSVCCVVVAVYLSCALPSRRSLVIQLPLSKSIFSIFSCFCCRCYSLELRSVPFPVQNSHSLTFTVPRPTVSVSVSVSISLNTRVLCAAFDVECFIARL